MDKPTQKNITLSQRIAAPMPPFFARIRNTGLVVGAIAGTILASPLELPPLLIEVAKYAALACASISAVASLTVDYSATQNEQ